MTVDNWPPNVWHGVIDPVTGDDIPPIEMESNFVQLDDGRIVDPAVYDIKVRSMNDPLSVDELPDKVKEELGYE